MPGAELLDRFLDEGYLVIPLPGVPAAVHEHLFDEATRLYEASERLRGSGLALELIADNLVTRMPELRKVLGAHAVHSTLNDILGRRYLRHSHAFIHSGGPGDQDWHKDSVLPWGLRCGLRSHRPNRAMAFYYPQETTLDMGPTMVLPGSQYWNVDHELPGYHDGEDRLDIPFGKDRLGASEDLLARDRRLRDAVRNFEPMLAPTPVTVPAGSVVLLHADLFHRASRAHEARPRFLFKFWFVRMLEPRVRRQMLSPGTAHPARQPVVNTLGSWLTGQAPETLPAPASVVLAGHFDNGSEAERIAAAYHLGVQAGEGDNDALARLGAALGAAAESTRRAAAYGLTASGFAAVPVALHCLQSPHEGVRSGAAFVLGEAATATSPVVQSLAQRVRTDAAADVRASATTALDRIARRSLADAETTWLPVILDALTASLDPVQQPNTARTVVPMSSVRQAAALALATITTQLIDNGLEIPRTLPDLLSLGLTDDDRYCAGTCWEALCRLVEHGVPAAGVALATAARDTWWRPLSPGNGRLT